MCILYLMLGFGVKIEGEAPSLQGKICFYIFFYGFVCVCVRAGISDYPHIEFDLMHSIFVARPDNNL